MRDTLRALAALLPLGVAAACAEDRVADRDTAVAAVAIADASDSAAAAKAWRVDPRGAGPVRAGMTLAELRAAVGGTLALPSDTASCAVVGVPGAPPGVRVMLVDGFVARVQVESTTVATSAGSRVGDSEDDVRARYGARVAASPHKYTDGRYLTVTPEAAADSAYRIVFETDGARVVRYRAGIRPMVEWVEGCS